MRRVGYDADTQKYTYASADGSYWEGEEGAEYGKLHRGNTPERSGLCIRTQLRLLAYMKKRSADG